MKTSLYSKYEKPHVPLHSTGKGWKKRSLSLLWFPAESSTSGILRNKNGLLKVVGLQPPQTIHFLPKWYLDWWKKSGYKLDPVEISLPLGWDVSCNPEKTNWDMFQNLSKIKTSTYSTTSTGSSHDFQGFIAWFPGVSYIFSIVSSGTVRKKPLGSPKRSHKFSGPRRLWVATHRLGTKICHFAAENSKIWMAFVYISIRCMALVNLPIYIYIYTSTCTNLPETPTKYYIL